MPGNEIFITIGSGATIGAVRDVNVTMGQPGPPGSGINAQLQNYRVVGQLPVWSGAVAIDMAFGNIIQPTLTGNVTSISISNWAPTNFESKLVLYIKQGATPYTIAGWPAEVVWVGGVPPSFSNIAGDVDIVVLSTVDGGATVMGFYLGRAS